MPNNLPPYQDPTLPLATRVQDLNARLTLTEKIGLMCHEAKGVPRLGLPAYNYWNEGLHGVARNGRATVFPQVIGLAATWDADLIQRLGSAIGDEGRAKYHEAVRRNGFSAQYQGLTFWSPNVNIFRDPRWGRGQETWGEDPYLTGEMAAAFVRGLQGDHPRYLKAAACAKHFAVHSGPERLRHIFDARVSARDLHDTYLPAFKKLVTEAHVEAVMGAYNRTNGEPCCASPLLLDDILRGQWGFTGHVVSDCWALNDFHQHHHVTADAVETAALALTHGCDLACGCTFEHLDEAITRGLATEADIDRALARTLTTRFKLGLFDPPEAVPFASIPMSVVGSPEHRALALEAARKSIVLLKNHADILPIRDEVGSLFITGPAAASADVLLGNYNGLSDSLTTILEGIARRAPEGLRMEYRPGVTWHQSNLSPVNWAITEAAGSDLTIACVGLSPIMEGEEGESILNAESGDRADITLPPAQVEFLRQMHLAGAKIVLVVTGGSPIALGEVEPFVQAILFAWYPGEAGGQAVAEVLFGNHAPSGKLPVTFPVSLAQLPPFEDYAMTGRTYRYMTETPLYPFGFGLSYARFAYDDLRLAQSQVKYGEALELTLRLTNAGECAAEEVTQIYLSDVSASAPVPRHSLIGFERVRLAPGESRRLSFTITPEMMTIVNDDGARVLEPGEFRATVGGCSPGARGPALGMSPPLTATFHVPNPSG